MLGMLCNYPSSELVSPYEMRVRFELSPDAARDPPLTPATLLAIPRLLDWYVLMAVPIGSCC